MTLSFSQKWPERMGELAGQPNYFVDKIWASFNPSCKDITTYNKRCRQLLGVDLFQYQDFLINAKLHTIREDKSNRWKAGMDIHFVINNRTKNRFQFAPIVKCKGTQYISITYIDDYPIVHLGNTQESCMPFYWENPNDEDDGYGLDQMKELSMNDGFPSVEAFFDYFNEDFVGKIIHWTNLKY